jgi:hypothetical protein
LSCNKIELFIVDFFLFDLLGFVWSAYVVCVGRARRFFAAPAGAARTRYILQRPLEPALSCVQKLAISAL